MNPIAALMLTRVVEDDRDRNLRHVQPRVVDVPSSRTLPSVRSVPIWANRSWRLAISRA